MLTLRAASNAALTHPQLADHRARCRPRPRRCPGRRCMLRITCRCRQAGDSATAPPRRLPSGPPSACLPRASRLPRRLRLRHWLGVAVPKRTRRSSWVLACPPGAVPRHAGSTPRVVAGRVWSPCAWTGVQRAGRQRIICEQAVMMVYGTVNRTFPGSKKRGPLLGIFAFRPSCDRTRRQDGAGACGKDL